VTRLNPADLTYDEDEQVGLISDGGELVKLDRHTDGQTNTQTNSDGHGKLDSDTDWRED
jgi:putative ATP-grasp target RiPP